MHDCINGIHLDVVEEQHTLWSIAAHAQKHAHVSLRFKYQDETFWFEEFWSSHQISFQTVRASMIDSWKSDLTSLSGCVVQGVHMFMQAGAPSCSHTLTWRKLLHFKRQANLTICINVRSGDVEIKRLERKMLFYSSGSHEHTLGCH